MYNCNIQVFFHFCIQTMKGSRIFILLVTAMAFVANSCKDEKFYVRVDCQEFANSTPVIMSSNFHYTGDKVTLSVIGIKGEEDEIYWSSTAPAFKAAEGRNLVIDSMTEAHAGTYTVYAKQGFCYTPKAEKTIGVNHFMGCKTPANHLLVAYDTSSFAHTFTCYNGTSTDFSIISGQGSNVYLSIRRPKGSALKQGKHRFVKQKQPGDSNYTFGIYIRHLGVDYYPSEDGDIYLNKVADKTWIVFLCDTEYTDGSGNTIMAAFNFMFTE